jgi:dolichyl-phosphate-mannose--protein O-mannosyl transferase
MKAYVMTTGAVFGLLVVAHIWRVIGENPALAKDPFYVVITIAAAALCFWAWRLLRLMPRS